MQVQYEKITMRIFYIPYCADIITMIYLVTLQTHFIYGKYITSKIKVKEKNGTNRPTCCQDNILLYSKYSQHYL